MKKLLFLTTLLCMRVSVFAQVFTAQPIPTLNSAAPNRGVYGNIVNIGAQTGTPCTIISGTVTPTTRPDTLVSPPTAATGYKTDSGFVQFQFFSRVDKLYTLNITTLSGTLAGTAVLQGSLDGQKWYNITGVVTYCASCVGASATLSGAGTSIYTWSVPGAGDIFPRHQIAVYMTGTCTATFSSTHTSAY